jgi:hypothetical protein
MTTQTTINIGDKFGRLTIIKELDPKYGKTGIKYRQVEALCECGEIKTYIYNSIKYGNTSSCGCLRKEVTSEKGKTSGTHTFIHGHSNHGYYPNGIRKVSPEYRTYYAMKNRCYNPKNKWYYLYGGKGIKVCDRWMEPAPNGFMNFLADMGNKPQPYNEYSIDRIDPNKDYEPSNCRWSTIKEQNDNIKSPGGKGKKRTPSPYRKVLSEGDIVNNFTYIEDVEILNRNGQHIRIVKAKCNHCGKIGNYRLATLNKQKSCGCGRRVPKKKKP